MLFSLLCYHGLLKHYLLHKLLDIGSRWGGYKGNDVFGIYSEDKFSRSIDFVSFSPLFLVYSKIMPGG